MPEGHGHSPLSHVVDHPTLELPHWQSPYGVEIDLPNLLGLQVTRFMVMEVVAAVLVAAVIIPLARHVARNPVSRGWFMNMFEAMVLFIRDEVARPAIGGHGADAFLPFLWTLFFFILFYNLLGMIPGGASATGNINVTAVLALMTLGAVVIAGIAGDGAGGVLGGDRAAPGRAVVAEAAALGPDVRHRGGRAADPPRRPGGPPLRQHAGRPHRPGGDPGLHPVAQGPIVLPGDAGEHRWAWWR